MCWRNKNQNVSQGPMADASDNESSRSPHGSSQLGHIIPRSHRNEHKFTLRLRIREKENQRFSRDKDMSIIPYSIVLGIQHCKPIILLLKKKKQLRILCI